MNRSITDSGQVGRKSFFGNSWPWVATSLVLSLICLSAEYQLQLNVSTRAVATNTGRRTCSPLATNTGRQFLLI